MADIQPIDLKQQQKVIAEVDRYLDLAADLYRCAFNPIDVVFDLRGQAAGMYRVKPGNNFFSSRKAQIRFNPWLFAKYEEDSWHNTIPHEVAHYIADCRFDLTRIKPHGSEWRQIMLDFGAEPKVRADYDLTDIPRRQVRRFDYYCGCRVVALSSYRHQKVQRGLQQYLCRDCRQPLVLQG